MSKSKKLKGGPTPLAYDQATPDLIEKVKAVIADAKAHRYSVSRVYTAHNKVFGLRDQPQSCSSCLSTRADNLRKWLDKMPKAEAPAPEGVADTPESTGNGANLDDADPYKVTPPEGQLKVNLTPVYDDPTNPAYVAPEQGVTRIPMAEGLPIDFWNHDVEDGAKGPVLYADGSKVKAGTYETARGEVIAVQPGGKGTFKVLEDLS